MENISIKVHPPWYARGTPVINPRDGPPMAENNKLLFAIGREPSARGNPAEVRSRQSVVGSQNHDFYRMEDQSRGNPMGKTRLWLTLKTTFYHTKNGVYGQWYGVLGSDLSACAAPDNVKLKWVYKTDADRSIDAVRSGEAAVDFDLSAYVAPDIVKMRKNVKMENAAFINAVKSGDVDRLEERSADDFDLSAYEVPRWIGTSSDNVKMYMVDADRSGDAVRSGKAAVDLSACAAPDNVKMVKRKNNVKKELYKVFY